MFCRTRGAKVGPDTEVRYCGVRPRTGHNFCKACGQASYADEAECTACGEKLVSEESTSKVIVGSPNLPSPIVMALISAFTFPWFGQFLMGQSNKGALMLIVSLILTVTCIGLFASVVGLVLWPISAIDAYCIAKKLRAGKAVGEWEFF
jgi:uncharacterized paraquat-inducible protein A